jgi:prophage regulatory protein
MQQHTQEPPRLISGREVQARTTLSRASLWRLVRDGHFPPPARLGGNRRAWREADVTNWIDAHFDK